MELHRKLTAVALLCLMLTPDTLFAYGVLSHEQLIDIEWNSDILPALRKRFPQASPEELKEAHAYSYGGSLVQDMGYYPFGNHDFTDLMHYVRSGDFVEALLKDAQNLNEYAFALGALGHWVSDCWGHPAVNQGVAIEYPVLAARYGKSVTYEEHPEAHLKTEFSFDVVQVAKQRYISQQYHDFIGFEVAEDLLQRAFHDTYALEMKDFLKSPDTSIGTFRFAIGQVIPEMTQVAVATRGDKLKQEKHTKARSEFLYHLSRADYEKTYGKKYQRPGAFARFLGWVLRVMPKFGPFKALAYRDPTAQTEDLYFKSMDNAVAEYHALVQQLEAGSLQLPNRNLDVGDVTRAGQYRLSDRAYAGLVRRLEREHFASLTPELKNNILSYFAGGDAAKSLKADKWRGTEQALAGLKTAPALPSSPDTKKPEAAPGATESRSRKPGS